MESKSRYRVEWGVVEDKGFFKEMNKKTYIRRLYNRRSMVLVRFIMMYEF